MNTIDEMLIRGRKVTNAHIKHKGEWCLSTQLLKIFEEVGELQKAETVENALDEGCDIIYSVITFFHLARFDDISIQDTLEKTMQKIENRTKNLKQHSRST